ncbi:MAG: hypothetical protein RL088_4131, partial [Verrucomicrobiota bacterium]
MVGGWKRAAPLRVPLVSEIIYGNRYVSRLASDAAGAGDFAAGQGWGDCRWSGVMPDDSADLFSMPAVSSPGEKGRVYSVGEVTKAVRAVIEGAFVEVWVEGEVSNYRLQASGHQYFTLKDADSQLSCVMFARTGMWRRSGVQLRDGMLVQAKGRLTVYEARGQYQLNVSTVQEAGAGQLQARFEALKRKLAAEGLFDAEHKRPLPRFPRVVGIATSPTGAALRDMVQILARRAPWVRVIVSPCRVQGAGAAAEIIEALDRLQQIAEPVDVIVVARGGGSMEDLWEFNSEALARAIAGSAVPVVSAVGHEIDFTIADFVADLRAPTPSAAAELVAPDTAEVLRQLGDIERRMKRAVAREIERGRAAVALLGSHRYLRNPAVAIEERSQRVDLAEQALFRAAEDRLAALRNQLSVLDARLDRHRPDRVLAMRMERLKAAAAKLQECAAAFLARRVARVEKIEAVLRVLSPDATLRRGYTITMDGEGRLLRTAAEGQAAEKIVTRFVDGRVASAP